MMDIWSATKNALTGLGLPLAANQYLAASSAELPDKFLVYQLISDPGVQHADDDEVLRSYRMQVSYYSRTGLADMPGIEAAMLAAKFTRLPGRELPFNDATRHYGFAFDFNYLNQE